jgi:hypothetical protein
MNTDFEQQRREGTKTFETDCTDEHQLDVFHREAQSALRGL